LMVSSLSLVASTASTAVFTTDSLIAADNTNYDGQDIVISNCVLTIDSLHNFASFRIAGTGTLTHSFAPATPIYASVTNETNVLEGTNATALGNPNVLVSSVVVWDQTHSSIY